jgi:hypothetical protein
MGLTVRSTGSGRQEPVKAENDFKGPARAFQLQRKYSG